MPGGDAGEDFAEWSFQQSEQALQQMLLRSGMGGGRSLADRVFGLLKRLKSDADWGEVGRDAAEVEAGAVEKGLPVGSEQPLYDAATAYAVDIEDAGYFAEQLQAQELPFNLRFDRREGMWRFSVEAERLARCSADFQDYFDFHSLDNVQSQLAIEGACSQSAAEAPDIDLPVFEPGAPSNKRFGFKTVEWDRNGEIMSSFLSEADIPFFREKINEGLVAFEVNQAHAGAVEEIADAMCKNIKGIKPSRFEFPEGFSAVQEVSAYRMELDPQTAEIVKGEFQAQGIEYTASQTGIDGQIEIVAQIHDTDALKRAYDNVVSREVSVVTPEQAETMQKAYQAQNAGRRASEQKKALEAQKNTTEKIAAERKRANPARDQREMTKSARQRAHGARSPKRTPNIGKGAK